MLGKIDDDIILLANDPSFLRGKVLSRVAGVASTALIALAFALELVIIPIILVLSTLWLGLSLISCNPKEIAQCLQTTYSFTKRTILTAGCLCFNIFVAIYDPKVMVSMHRKVEENSKIPSFKDEEALQVTEQKKAPPPPIIPKEPSIHIPQEYIDLGINQIRDENKKRYDTSVSEKDPIAVYGPKKNGKKAYAIQLARALGHSSDVLTIDMEEQKSREKAVNTFSNYFEKTLKIENEGKHITQEMNGIEKKYPDKKKMSKKDQQRFVTLSQQCENIVTESKNCKLPILYIKNFTPTEANKKCISTFAKSGFFVVCDVESEQEDLFFKTQLHIPFPAEEERKTLIEKQLKKCPQKDEHLNIQKIVEQTANMPRKQVLAFVKNGIYKARKEGATVSDAHFTLQKKSTPKIDYVENKELTNIFDKHLAIIQHWEEAQKTNTRMPAGILLHGAPGCGKTYAAKSLEAYAEKKGVKMHFETINARDVTGQGIVGDGIREMAAIFKKVEKEIVDKKVDAGIIFIDECEGLLHKRLPNNGANAVELNKEIGNLLILIDEAKAKKIIVIGATNFLDRLDQAMIRDARFDYRLEIKAPDPAMKRKIFELNLKDKNCEKNLDLDALVKETIDLPASSIDTIINDASVQSLMEGKPISTAMLRNEIKQKLASRKNDENLHAQQLPIESPSTTRNRAQPPKKTFMSSLFSPKA